MENEFKNLEDVKKKVEKCTLCNLHNNRCKSVFSRGNDKAKIMLIGEAPGEEENKTGIPFYGKAGNNLDKLLKKVGFNPDKDIYFCNTVKCRPLNNKDPLVKQCKACKNFLDAQIKFINPKIIVLCGKIATRNFEFIGTMTKLHGKFYEKNRRQFFIIYHPASRIKEEIKVKDLKKLKGKIC